MNSMIILMLLKVGDKVKKGQVVCIIEAMKLMNEIEVCVFFMFMFVCICYIYLCFLTILFTFHFISVICRPVSIKIYPITEKSNLLVSFLLFL
jgi:hypothetical protein